MLFFVRTTKGSVIYARLKNPSGQYWDFSALAWVSIENPNCKILLFEYADSDPLESLYMNDADIPVGGPWIEEAVDDTGSVIAFDDRVMGELQSIPNSSSTLQEKLEFIFQYLAGKRTATSVLETMHTSSGAVLGTAALSDDGVTFTKEKVN
jgi:hypothetical protein